MSNRSLGYHASHEQFPPGALVGHVRAAEAAGFDRCLASDHFHPWSERQGESGHVWAWLGAALTETDLEFATVTAPGYRYHPAIVAQAVATLRSMFGPRYQLCVGSGQLLNEGIIGEYWPAKSERNARLEECVEVLRRLWDGERVSHYGSFDVAEAKLHTRPDEVPSIIGAALSVETAEWIASWADGMITLGTPDLDADRERIQAFRQHAPDKPVFLKSQLSYAEELNAARAGAYEQWRTNCIPGVVTQELRTAEAYDQLGALIDETTVANNVRVAADLDQHIEWIASDFEHGADAVYLHNVNTNQQEFIEHFGEHVIPSF